MKFSGKVEDKVAKSEFFFVGLKEKERKKIERERREE